MVSSRLISREKTLEIWFGICYTKTDNQVRLAEGVAIHE